ncbi:MAG: dimethylsulfoniopropionate demethylase, partial [Gammaproteobacteria bacterium]|nr:dimethylsulfoniopropionate demethylase [Gammaproteobacteria bacterium]
WPVTSDNKQVGYVTSAHWSPRFNQNVALAMLDQGYWDANTLISIRSGDGQQRNGIVIALPMEDQ